MQHSEHVHLIKKGISKKGGVWADFGSGEGAFALALRDLAGPDVIIYSVDQDKKPLSIQEKEFKSKFPNTQIHFIQEDFTKDLILPSLDGIIMANSLHYVKDQVRFLTTFQKYLSPHGTLVLIEYSIDSGNKWVPYPLSFGTFDRLAKRVGFSKVELLEKIPSTYWDEMYSAQAIL